MDELVKFALHFKKAAKDSYKLGICKGKVVNISPIQIMTQNIMIEFDKKNLFSVGDITLKKGDVVVMMPSEEGQKYFVLGKAGDISVSG